jgi:hypothetical protein
MSNLSAEVLRIRDVFSSAADLKVPPYQRSYSWTTKEVDELLDDLMGAFEAAQIYFLGAMVVIQNRQRGPQDVVDGQQRLTTLTIMLAVLRDLAPSEDWASPIHELIGHQRGMWGPARWRLTLNHLDVEFFRTYVQTPGATMNPNEMMEHAQSQSQRNLAIAVRRIHDELTSEMTAEIRNRFFRWLSEEVTIVSVKVGQYNLGYKVFLVLNRRGMPLADHDILKSALFQRASFLPAEAIHHSTLWQTYANRLGQDPFERMLKQVRFIYDPRMQGEFIDSFLKSIMQKMTIATFINSALPRFVDGYDAVMNGHEGSFNLGESAKRSLCFLRSIHHESWRAPAIKFLGDNPHDPDESARFFSALERLAYMLQYSVSDREYRHRRYRRVMEAMDNNTLYEKGSPLLLTADEKSQFLSRLHGRFPNWKQRRALMMRISASVPGGAAIDPDADATVEHILPRTPQKGTEWFEEWNKAKDRDELTESIGNFTLLTDADNQEVDRKPFLQKLDGYFKNGGEPTFALSLDLKGRKHWTPDDVRSRRDKLISYLAGEWELETK